LVCLGEFLDRTVIGALYIVGEKASWQFTGLPMISYTFAANALPAAWLIGAVTFFLVLLQ
jgi:hypothetical protein